MKSFFLGITAAGLLWAGLPTHAQNPEPTLYGITFFGGELIAVNPTTGQASSVGTLDAAVAGYGLAARYGRLYSFDAASDRVIEISPSSGRVLRQLDVGLPDLSGEGDITFRSDGVGFLSSAFGPGGSTTSELYEFNVVAGLSSRVGNTGIVVDAMAFGPDGRLYALGQGEGFLYTLDPKTGVATEIGPLGIPQNSPFAAMAFSPEGALYVSVDDRLAFVNIATGSATVVDTSILDFGFSSVSGLAFQVPDSPLQLFALTFFGNELLSVSTNGSAAFVGKLSSIANGYGLAARQGNLYTFDPKTDRISEVRSSTGAALASFDVGTGNLTGEGDIAFRSDGLGFITSALSPALGLSADLIAFDLPARSSRRIGTTSVPLDAIAFDSHDVLYAVGQGEGKLYIVDQQSAALTEIGDLGVVQNSPFAAMTFAPNGTLYAALDDRLYTVSTATGVATQVDSTVLDFGFSSVSGLAIATLDGKLGIVEDAAGPALFWTGEGYNLESSQRLGGNWVTYNQQGNPQRLPVDDAERYFRLRR